MVASQQCGEERILVSTDYAVVDTKTAPDEQFRSWHDCSVVERQDAAADAGVAIV